MNKVLIIQTAFIGDVILATSLIESIHQKDPDIKIDFLLRKGNEGLLKDHPFIHEVLIWDKSSSKYRQLFSVIKEINRNKYDTIINLQRFASTGFITWKSKAKTKVGFKKNSFSFALTHKIEHEFGTGIHEIERNFELIKCLADFQLAKPKLYPNKGAYERVRRIVNDQSLIVMAPSSVWFTKQLPEDKWVKMIDQYDENKKIVLIGGKNDRSLLENICSRSKKENVVNLAGELNLLESAALISMAEMTHVNDSAPLHLASAMNAPVTAYFCSTIPMFGFTPLSDTHFIKETAENLTCRPCGIHGRKSCPKGHFKCGKGIDVTLN